MYPGVPVMPPNFKTRLQTVEDIEELERDLRTHQNDVANRLMSLEATKATLMADRNKNNNA